MSDLGELYKVWGETKKAKKQENIVSSRAILEVSGIKFEKFSDTHYRVGEFDFWPSTGLFISKAGRRGRGIDNLLKALGPKEPLAPQPEEPEHGAAEKAAKDRDAERAKKERTE